MENNHYSTAYKLLRIVGLNYPADEYGRITIWQVIRRVCKTYRDGFLLKFVMDCWLLNPICPRKVRPWVLKKIGCKIGKDVFIGSGVWIDSGHSDLITIEDHAHLDARCVVLCHKRDLSEYYVGDDYAKFPYKKAPIRLCRGCSVGTDTILMPGVTVGEGSIVGAGSIVTKDIPAWTVAVGRPAKAVRQISKRETT